MARIPLYERAPLLQTGTQVLKPAQFAVEPRSAIGEGLMDIGRVAGSFAIKMQQDRKNLENANTLAEVDNISSQYRLEIAKWQRENPGDDMLDQYEPKVGEYADKLRQQFGNVRDPELKLRINSYINKWDNDMRIDAYQRSTAQLSENFTNRFNSAVANAKEYNDWDGVDTLFNYARDNNIWTPDQLALKTTEINQEKKLKLLEDSNYVVQTYVAAKNADAAYQEIDRQVSSGLIREKEGAIKKDRIKSTIEYNTSLEDVIDIDLNTNPAEVLKGVDDAIKRVPAAPTGFAEEIEGNATVWGLNLDGTPDPEDKGQTAWGAINGIRTDNKTTRGVSLPFATLEKMFGPNYSEYIAQSWRDNNPVMIEVTNPKTGKTTTAPIIDKGPAARTGNAIDLTYAVATELGSTGKDTMRFKLVGAEGAPAEGGSKYSKFRSSDLRRLQLMAQEKVMQMGGVEYKNIFESIKNGQFDSVDIETTAKFDDLLASQKYLTDDMRQLLRLERTAQIDKSWVNAPEIVKQLMDDIDTYGEAMRESERTGQSFDPDGFGRYMLGAKIDAYSENSLQTNLRQRLDRLIDNQEARETYKKIAGAKAAAREVILNFRQPAQAVIPGRAGIKIPFTDIRLGYRPDVTVTNPITQKEARDPVTGGRVTIDVPVTQEIGEEEKQERLLNYNNLEQNLIDYIQGNPNATPDQVKEQLLKDPIYNMYRNQQSRPAPSAATPAAGAMPAEATPVADPIQQAATAIRNAKSKDELNAIRAQVYKTGDMGLIETYNRKIKSTP